MKKQLARRRRSAGPRFCGCFGGGGGEGFARTNATADDEPVVENFGCIRTRAPKEPLARLLACVRDMQREQVSIWRESSSANFMPPRAAAAAVDEDSRADELDRTGASLAPKSSLIDGAVVFLASPMEAIFEQHLESMDSLDESDTSTKDHRVRAAPGEVNVNAHRRAAARASGGGGFGGGGGGAQDDHFGGGEDQLPPSTSLLLPFGRPADAAPPTAHAAADDKSQLNRTFHGLQTPGSVGSFSEVITWDESPRQSAVGDAAATSPPPRAAE